MRKVNHFTDDILLVNATPVFAYTPTGLPWDGPLSTLINGLQGGLAHAMLAVGVIVAGIGWTFWQEFGPAAKALVGVIAGGAIAGAALNIMTYLGSGGGDSLMTAKVHQSMVTSAAVGWGPSSLDRHQRGAGAGDSVDWTSLVDARARHRNRR